MESVCPICGQPMTNENSNLHHLIPVLKGGKVDDTIRMHIVCHNKLHSIWSEAEMRDYWNTIPRILESEDIQKFIKWVRKQNVDTKISHRMKKDHKKKRKR